MTSRELLESAPPEGLILSIRNLFFDNIKFDDPWVYLIIRGWKNLKKKLKLDVFSEKKELPSLEPLSMAQKLFVVVSRPTKWHKNRVVVDS